MKQQAKQLSAGCFLITTPHHHPLVVTPTVCPQYRINRLVHTIAIVFVSHYPQAFQNITCSS